MSDLNCIAFLSPAKSTTLPYGAKAEMDMSDYSDLDLATRFVGLCCRWPQTQKSQAALATLASQIQDWTEIWDCVQRHRVVPLVFHALSTCPNIPPAFFERCQTSVRKSALNALRQTGECARIEAELGKLGIPVTHVKGPCLAQQVFGSVSMKLCKDIDIYVAKDQAERALQHLEQDGYRFIQTRQKMTPRLRRALLRHVKDIEMINDQGLILELHWRLTMTPDSAKRTSQFKTTQLAVPDSLPPDITVTVPQDADHFAYLCIHGARHDWARLKWLADVAAFWETRSPQDRLQLLAAVQAQKGNVACAQALGLAHLIMGTTPPPADLPQVQTLISHGIRHIQAPYYTASVTARLRRHWSRILVHWRYLQSVRELPGVIAAFLVSPKDVIQYPLPRALDPLYVVIRVPSYFWRRLKEAFIRR